MQTQAIFETMYKKLYLMEIGWVLTKLWKKFGKIGRQKY